MEEKQNNRKNIYLTDKIARQAACRRDILSYNIFDFFIFLIVEKWLLEKGLGKIVRITTGIFVY